ncbi:MAG: RNA polymerase sigma-70 factor [Bacteroidetes bacterium]|nr:RNA polymerase sigma-70 factor [Bacteroidota bacterium]
MHLAADRNEHSIEMAFADIFNEHAHSLYILAFRLTKSDQQAKDIVQEVFLKLWEGHDNIHEIKNIEAWLFTLAQNKVIDYLRKTAATTRLRNALWEKITQLPDEIDAAISIKEYNDILSKAIDRLPPQRKLIYKLNREKDLNYQEIADHLKISRHTVKNQLSTAVKSIRAFFSHMSRTFF